MAALTLAPWLASPASAEETVFTYSYDGCTYEYFGSQRNVRTDAAMLLNEPGLTGMQILGVSVDIPTLGECKCDPNAAAWLTTKLGVDGEDYTYDIIRTWGEIKNYGTEEAPELRLDITFDEPYTLTDKGVYVGYSLQVLSCKTPGGSTLKYPLTLVDNIDKPECFMIHCNKGESTLPQKYVEWTDLGQSMHQALAMRVILGGATIPDGAMLEPQQTLYIEPGKSGNVYTNIVNYGNSPINSFEYTYTVGGKEYTEEVTLDTPVLGQIGAYQTLDLVFNAENEPGEYNVPVTLTKINGEENGYAEAGMLAMTVVPFVPVNNPVVEDVTGLWCGYCPQVYVNCLQMNDKYGHDFLALAYHSVDRLQTVPSGDMPIDTYGPPKVYMGDRKNTIDFMNMETLWQRARRQLAPAQVDVKLYWENEEHLALMAKADVKFVYDDPDAEYMLAYAMVEDGMSDPSWMQANSISNYNYVGPYWDLFIGQPRWVKGLTYDDVIVSFPHTTGVAGSLPAQITAGEVYNHLSTMPLENAKCAYAGSDDYGKNVIQNTDKLRIVALLIDGKTGNVCNAATTAYAADAPLYNELSAVDGINADATVESVEYYSLEGVRLQGAPEHGICIEVKRLSTGNTQTKKILK